MSTADLDMLNRLARDDLDARRELARELRRLGDPRGNMLEQACTSPSPPKWTRLLELAELQPAHEHRQLVTWLTPYAAHWPEHVRVPLPTWQRALGAGEPHTLAYLCRKLVTERSTTPATLRRMLDHRALRAVTCLEIGFNELDGQAARVVATCPLRNLHTLSLTWCGLGPDEVRTLASWDGMRRLFALDLSYNEIGHEGTGRVANPSLPGMLVSLTLANNQLTNDGIAPLTTDTGLHALEFLSLRSNALNSQGLTALAHSPGLPALTALDLAENLIDDEGIAALLASPLAARLEQLDLTSNYLTDASALALARSRALPRLHRLALWKNTLGAEAKEALRAWKKAAPGRSLVL